MKSVCRFYPAQVLEWKKKDTGEVKRGWLQKYDLAQGSGVRTLQNEIMHMNQAQVLAPGEYEVEFILDKDRRGFLVLEFLDKRLMKSDAKPQAVNA